MRLRDINIKVLDERSPGAKYPYWMYLIQCPYGACTWWAKGKRLRKLENDYVDHDIDWHGAKKDWF